jgi:hypothetical protein
MTPSASDTTSVPTVWVFTGRRGAFPGGVFRSLDLAEPWIRQHRLSGTLTAYPLDQGCFDWADAAGCTGLSRDKLALKRQDPDFIGSFSTAAQEHFHYENGARV